MNEADEFIAVQVYQLYPELEKYRDKIQTISATPNSSTFDGITISEISEKVRDRNAEVVILFDGSEALRDYSLKKLEGVIRLSRVNRDKFYWITGSLEADKNFKDAQSKLKVGDINFLLSNIFIEVVRKNNVVKNPEYSIAVKERLFNCLNRNHRAQRGLLVAALIDHNLLDRSYTSMYGAWNHPTWIENMTSFMSHYDTRLTEIFLNHRDLFPLHINASKEKRENPIWIEQEDRHLYENTYFSVVTETIFFTDRHDGMAASMLPGIFITEKTYKPISMKHPFIILSVPLFLNKLRELGLKTFHPFINESYDEEKDDMKRFYMIIDEIVRLSKFSDQEWIEWQRNIKEIVEYNHHILYNEMKEGLSNIDPLIRRLEELK